MYTASRPPSPERRRPFSGDALAWPQDDRCPDRGHGLARRGCRGRTSLASDRKARYRSKWQGPGVASRPLQYTCRDALATRPALDERRHPERPTPVSVPRIASTARPGNRFGRSGNVRALVTPIIVPTPRETAGPWPMPLHPKRAFTPGCDKGTFASVGGVLVLLTPHQAGICPANMPRRVSGQASEGRWPRFPRPDSDHLPFLRTPIARKSVSGDAGCPARLLFPPLPGGGGTVHRGNGWTALMKNRLAFPARPGNSPAGPGIVRAHAIRRLAHDAGGSEVAR